MTLAGLPYFSEFVLLAFVATCCVICFREWRKKRRGKRRMRQQPERDGEGL